MSTFMPKWTVEEEDELCRLGALGGDWDTIATELAETTGVDRSPAACQAKYRKLTQAEQGRSKAVQKKSSKRALKKPTAAPPAEATRASVHDRSPSPGPSPPQASGSEIKAMKAELFAATIAVLEKMVDQVGALDVE
ncbi:hypothetical protein MNV49_000249 [Pseudohyphozyma bogoriensis]|nr:hypothetical protein MNV49_000249 [Pseudohyphozyma bogoriensis]